MLHRRSRTGLLGVPVTFRTRCVLRPLHLVFESSPVICTVIRSVVQTTLHSRRISSLAAV